MPDSLTPEQRQELARFPDPLRALVEAELAAGNTIVEIGHSHPAPPVGAYVAFARKVSTRPRVSGGGLDFYERHSSLHSGEFTDGGRFFWVLEPPDPPPPEPDMDAIRRALEPRSDPIARLADRQAGALVASLHGDGDGASAPLPGGRDGRAHEIPAARTEPVIVDDATSRAFLLVFHDVRPPHEIQALCEREMMTRFVAAPETHPLAWRGEANVNGALWTFLLTFEAALAQANRYVLRAEAAWLHLPEMHHEYERRSSTSWFALWTRDLAAVEADAGGAGARDRYAALRAAALEADARLDTVNAVQRAIVAGMTRGGRYSTSHKEGGTNITWQHDRFVRSDYGDDPALETFIDEAAFLAMLWNFGRWDATRHARDGQRSELDTWILILRRMRPS